MASELSFRGTDLANGRRPRRRIALHAALAGLVLIAVSVTPSGGPLDLGTISLRRSGDRLLVSSDLGGSDLVIEATVKNTASNGGFNLLRTELRGSVIHDTRDDIAPIRTQMGTVGGNHGFPVAASFANPDGKTTADLGSVWTDGSRNYVLLAIDEDGRLIVGGSYETRDGVVRSEPVAPTEPLTHISGAVHRGKVTSDSKLAQLYPSTGRVRVTTSCDEVPAGVDERCHEVEVRESYEVLDYGNLYDQAKSHVGQSYADLPVKGAVRIENTYRFLPEGRTRVSAEITALSATTLGETGLLQSVALTPEADETVIRQVPGVQQVYDHDFRRGVDLSRYDENVVITSSELVSPEAPPTFSLDRIVGAGSTRAGFALGYVPTGDQAGSQAARSTAARAESWDLRASRKSYPVALTDRALREGDHVKVEGFRTYLTPARADQLSAAVAAGHSTDGIRDLW